MDERPRLLARIVVAIDHSQAGRGAVSLFEALADVFGRELPTGAATHQPFDRAACPSLPISGWWSDG